MVDIKLIRKNPMQYKKAAKDKNIVVDIDRLLVVDNKLRQCKRKQQEQNAVKNRANKKFKTQIK